MLQSMLGTIVLLLARLQHNALEGKTYMPPASFTQQTNTSRLSFPGPLRTATSSDGAARALSELQLELFRRTAQFLGSLSPTVQPPNR